MSLKYNNSDKKKKRKKKDHNNNRKEKIIREGVLLKVGIILFMYSESIYLYLYFVVICLI